MLITDSGFQEMLKTIEEVATTRENEVILIADSDIDHPAIELGALIIEDASTPTFYLDLFSFSATTVAKMIFTKDALAPVFQLKNEKPTGKIFNPGLHYFPATKRPPPKGGLKYLIYYNPLQLLAGV